jgi:hypothetical protein
MRRSSDRGNRSRLAGAAYLLACGIGVASIGWACGGEEASSPEPAASPGAPAPGEAPPPAAAPSAQAPEATATDGVIPEGYPSDVPVYPGAAPGSAMAMPGLGVFATFASDDSVEKILEYYRTELAKGGWSVSDSPDGGGVDGAKAGRTVQVRARQGDGGRSEIAVSTSEG